MMIFLFILLLVLFTSGKKGINGNKNKIDYDSEEKLKQIPEEFKTS